MPSGRTEVKVKRVRPEALLLPADGYLRIDRSLLGWHFGILIHPSSRLPPQPSGFDVLHQEWCRAIFLTQSLVQILEDVQAGIEPNQIGQLGRSEERRVGKEGRSRWAPDH